MKTFPIVVRSMLVVLAAGLVSPSLGAADVVVPGSLSAAEGNSNVLMFNTFVHYQQVYAAAEFPMQPQRITGLFFRTDGTFGFPFSASIPSAILSLSTTTKLPDQLSSTFAANVGADNTIVFSGPLMLSSSFPGGALSGPAPFDVFVHFMAPFVYNPAQGNLLLELRETPVQAGSIAPFDAINVFGDSVSSLYASDGAPGPLPVGQSFTNGAVTLFAITPVPEPTTAALICIGVALALGRRLLVRMRYRLSREP